MKEIESKVRTYLEERLDVEFEPSPLSIGTRERVDGWVRLSSGWLLILEVEDQQTHPTTNVLKLWPYLEQQPNASVVLIHVYFPKSRAFASSRSTLATWLGKKLEEIFPSRFAYRRLDIDWQSSSCTGYEELQSMLRSINQGRTKR